MRTINRDISNKRNAKYDDLQKDKKSDVVRKAFEHKPYTINDSLRKMGVLDAESTEVDSKGEE